MVDECFELESTAGLDNSSIMDAVENALEDTLGTNTKVLILKILKTTYKLDSIACNLEHFEELLARFLGTYSAKIVKDRVILELRKKR